MKDLGRRGFTLVETLVVLALAGVVTAIAAPRLAGFLSTHRVENAAEGIAATMRHERIRAVVGGGCARVRVSDTNRSVTVERAAAPCDSTSTFRVARGPDPLPTNLWVRRAGAPVFLPRGGVDPRTDGAITLSTAKGRGGIERSVMTQENGRVVGP